MSSSLSVYGKSSLVKERVDPSWSIPLLEGASIANRIGCLGIRGGGVSDTFQ